MASRKQHQLERAGAIKQIAAADTGRTTTDQCNSGANWRSVAGNADTLGIVADIQHPEGLALAQATVRETGDPELRNLLTMAQAIGMRYVIAAGRFNGKGIFGAMCANKQDIAASIQMANERMNDVGSRATAWMAKPDSLALLINGLQCNRPQRVGT